jgi:Flp pilus assembly protein TadD
MIALRTPILALLALVPLAGCAGGSPAGLREPDRESRLRVAAVAEASGQTDIALSIYAAAAAAEPGRVEAQARFAAALLRIGDTARADEVLSSALGRHPDDPALLNQLGRLRLRTDAAEAALGLFDRLLVSTPRNAAGLDGRGVALDLLSRHAEAQQSYRAALAVAPSSITAGNNLAISLMLTGRPAEARELLQALARRPGAPPRVAVNLAIARAAAGEKDGTAALAERMGGGGVELEGMLTALAAGPGPGSL